MLLETGPMTKVPSKSMQCCLSPRRPHRWTHCTRRAGSGTNMVATRRSSGNLRTDPVATPHSGMRSPTRFARRRSRVSSRALSRRSLHFRRLRSPSDMSSNGKLSRAGSTTAASVLETQWHTRRCRLQQYHFHSSLLRLYRGSRDGVSSLAEPRIQLVQHGRVGPIYRLLPTPRASVCVAPRDPRNHGVQSMTVEGTVTVPRDWPSVLFVALIVSKTHPPSSVWFP